jgi:hypothetical protein
MGMSPIIKRIFTVNITPMPNLGFEPGGLVPPLEI